jgi:hypothetical protein
VLAAVQSKLGGGFTLTTDPCIGGGAVTCPSTPNTPNTGYIWYSSSVGQTGHHPVTVKITYLFQPWVPVIRDASGNGVTMTAESTMVTEY